MRKIRFLLGIPMHSFWLSLGLLMTSACTDNKDSGLIPAGAPTAGDLITPSTPGTTDTATPVLSLREQIEALEKSGKMPALDRSSSILGPDVNSNGVRDDIEAFINGFGFTPVQTKAAMQTAKALQKSLAVDTTNKDAVQSVGEYSMAATKCIFSRDCPLGI